MNRLFLGILVSSLCLAGMTGCQKQAPAEQPAGQKEEGTKENVETTAEEATEKPQRTSFTIGGGPQGGGWYGLAGQLASECENVISGMKFSVMPGGGIGNIDLTEKGEMDISTTVSHLYRSRRPWQELPHMKGKNIRICPVWPRLERVTHACLLLKSHFLLIAIQEMTRPEIPDPSGNDVKVKYTISRCGADFGGIWYDGRCS